MSDISPKNLQFLFVGDFEIKEWKSKIGSIEVSFWTIISKKKILVFGNEFATTVGFTNPRKAFADHVDPEDITTIENVFGKDFKLTLKQYFQGCNDSLHPLFFQNLQPHQKLLSKPAIYALCMNSKLPEIKPFRRWVYDLIDQVLETGYYIPPNIKQLSLEETPVEKVESTFKFIPNFEFDGDNTERKELNKVFTTGKEASKNLKKSRDGTGGGLKTQSNVRTLKIFARDFYLESKDLDEDDESKLQFFKNKLEELKEIIMEQKLLTKQFETKK